MLVIGPLGEAGQERVHALAEGVVDVRTVHVNEHTGLIQVVVGVAGNVVAALEDGDAEADGLGEATGAHRTRIARTDDDLHDSSLQVATANVPSRGARGRHEPRIAFSSNRL